MKNTAMMYDDQSLSSLQYARALDLPSRQEVLHRSPSVQHFWNSHRGLLVSAWREWENSEKHSLPVLDSSLLDENLRSAVKLAWENPTTEVAVRNLWKEVSTGVYMCQFFDPERLADLRDYLEKVASANIPTRPPYGIALNRYGAMLDPRSEGYLAAPSFQAFYHELLNQYMRPIARLLFPEVMGYDTQTFGFSIQYEADADTSLRLHSDASAATLNINLNRLDEEFTGSEVDFHDPLTGQVNRLTFKPGMAMLHRGAIAHAAQPITSGSRTNFVLWLYGDNGRIPVHNGQSIAIDARQRWHVSSATSDNYAPF